MLYAILILALVVLDQVVKFLVRAHIPWEVPSLPAHILELTYVQNTGAAFSMLSQHTWLLTLLSGVVSVVLVICLGKESSPTGRGCWPWPFCWAGRGELH